MKSSIKFSVSSRFKLLLLDMGVNLIAVLNHAKLPADLFNRHDVSLSAKQYFQLWYGIDKATGDEEVALLLAKYISTESFDAPIFAALCCQDFISAVLRLSKYKPLIGPMQLMVKQKSLETDVQVECAVENSEIPYALCMSEAVFFTRLIRLGTRENICPKSVTLPELPKNMAPYQDFFGCNMTKGAKFCISFHAIDASKPFLTSSGSMWDFFEDKLNQKLADVTSHANTSERVRASLIEALPSGDVGIDIIASKLAMSKRTLQRKLTDEAETFQAILIKVREQLAQHYLEKSELSLGEISYLLGFKEPNSFIRAFNSWQGISPNIYRNQSKH